MNALAKKACEARKLGLTYGQYMAYEQSGYLEQYKRTKFHELCERQDIDKREKSSIGGGKGQQFSFDL